ncbi:MAG: hypothetical protein RLZZ241_235 [Bacteroidota bacterium]|jgi:formiminoglutamase
MRYQAPTADFWQGRKSNHADYLHEKIHLLPLDTLPSINRSNKEPVIIGYKCDAGVSRNLGRPGATDGPDALRNVLGKMPAPIVCPDRIWDAGNVLCPDDLLEASQQALAQHVENLLNHGYFPIVIGGGHDMAFGHFMGINNHLKQAKTLGIINFDAHLDLRLPHPIPHSGSPFYQIAKTCESEKTTFNYACLGLRYDANPKELWDRANTLNVLQIMRSELCVHKASGALKKLEAFLSVVDFIYLTIDLDGFSSAVAPGVSAASPMGFYPEEVAPFLDLILKSKKLISMDLAELNPGLDRDRQTAILGASLVQRVIGENLYFHK